MRLDVGNLICPSISDWESQNEFIMMDGASKLFDTYTRASYGRDQNVSYKMKAFVQLKM